MSVNLLKLFMGLSKFFKSGIKNFVILFLILGLKIFMLMFYFLVFNSYGYMFYLFVYVDDLIMMSDNNFLVDSFVNFLVIYFFLKDFDLLLYFFSVEVVSNNCGILFF